MDISRESGDALRERALATLLRNLEKTGGKYVCPSWPHYGHRWLWDSCAHAIALAFLGRKEEAKNEFRWLLSSQRPDGFIPHMAYRKRHGPLWELERFTFLRWMHSDYSQPPLLAQALWWIDDSDFTREVFDRVVRFFLYFRERQDPDKDALISNFHQGETGRDSSPEFDPYILRIPGRHRILNTALHGFSWLKRGAKYRWMGWDIERIVADDGFDVEDLMFNCIWVDGMYILAQMTESASARGTLTELASQTENAILQHCWDEETQIFYSLAKGNEKIRCVTVSNLFPLLLPRLPKDRATSIVGHLTNPNKFWTSYPIPSVAVDEPTFDPDRVESLLWRGGSWDITTHFIAQGLFRQGYAKVAQELIALTDPSKMEEAEQDFPEFRHPFTGKGMRVKNFSMATIAVVTQSFLEDTSRIPLL